jgi:hypothetical protein
MRRRAGRVDPPRRVAVVTVLRQTPSRTGLRRRPASIPAGRLWWIVLLDAVTVAWMIALGSWLDRNTGHLSVVTLGGRHEVVIAVAGASFVVLAVVAVTSEGFTSLSRVELIAAALAGLMTVVAITGLLAVLIVVVGGGLFVGLMAKLLLR